MIRILVFWCVGMILAALIISLLPVVSLIAAFFLGVLLTLAAMLRWF